MNKHDILNHELSITGIYETNCKECGKPFKFELTIVRLVGAYYPEQATCPHCQTINQLGVDNG